MKVHLISDKIYYLSLEQNNYTFEMKQSMKNVYAEMEESRINEIIDYLKKRNDSYYIIDAFNVQPIFSMSNLEDIICERFALLGINEKTFNVIRDNARSKGVEISFRRYNLPVEEDRDKQNYYIILFANDKINVLWNYVDTNIMKLGNEEDVQGFYDLECVRHIVAAMLKEDIENNNKDQWSYLESSNVYIKNYLNVKCLFADPYVFDLIIIKMRQLIEKTFMGRKGIEEKKKVSLMGVSNNGIILSRILAYIMEMDSESINHLGPTYCMEGAVKDLERYKDRQYILVSDVVCLGGEYRMTKGIVSMLGSRLLGAVGIVKVRDVYRNEKKDDNIAIAVLEKIEQYGIKYEIYIDKEDDNGSEL